MIKVKMYQVDAFADRLFSGNPAAVCVLDEWISKDMMQLVGAENNLAETAFIVPRVNCYEIRWFTPSVEVDLCGHATLAAGYVLFNCLDYKGPEIIFNSPVSGELKVSRQEDLLYLDFPTDTLVETNNTGQIMACIGIQPTAVYKGKTDFIAVFEKEQDIRDICPNFTMISKLDARGLIVTAKGELVDFVSRFFAPQSGVSEDPVTGSAHTSLIPLWSQKLGKREMVAKQLSKRGGTLFCVNNGQRSLIGGEAKLYMTGEINIG